MGLDRSTDVTTSSRRSSSSPSTATDIDRLNNDLLLYRQDTAGSRCGRGTGQRDERRHGQRPPFTVSTWDAPLRSAQQRGRSRQASLIVGLLDTAGGSFASR